MAAESTLTARWILPVAGPPLERGTITIRDGRIAAVEPRGMRTADEDLGNAAIVPGFVNAHTHLDLSGARGLIAPTPEHFTDWLRGVIAFRRSRSPADVQADIRAGLAECLRFGTTLLGDISADGCSWDALAAAEVRAVVFREVIGLGPDWRDRFDAAKRWLGEGDTPMCRRAISPHAPYTVRESLLEALEDLGAMTAMHVAESPHEAELIERRSGPFAEFLRSLGFTDLSVLAGRMVRFTRSRLIVHGNYLPVETRLHSDQSIVYCPRTHAAFGHPPHPFREFLKSGNRVCLGTDSLASNPDLDVLAEARFLHARYPEVAGEMLRTITLAGAEALGCANETGSLEVGKAADLVAVPLPDREAGPYELLFAEHDAPRRTMLRGQWFKLESLKSNGMV